jgi:hypothetical protein
LAKLEQNSACIFSKEKIKLVHEEYVKNLTYSQIEPLTKKTFTVAGLDINKKPTIDDGWLSLQISLDDSGVKSTYTFGTTKMVPPRRMEVYSSSLEARLNNRLGRQERIVSLKPKA